MTHKNVIEMVDSARIFKSDIFVSYDKNISEF